MRLHGYHLPGIPAPRATTWEYGGAEGDRIQLRVARLTPELLSRQIDALLVAREEHLVARPAGSIVTVIDRVARRFLESGSRLREEAIAGIAAVTGYSIEMATLVLDGMAADWTAEGLHRLLETELGNPRVLDEFVARPGLASRTRAFGPPLVLHVFSGNVPGVPVTSLVRALLVKSASLAKTSAGEPILPSLFAAALAEEDPALGACLAVTYWPGGDEPLERIALDRADAVIAYGGSDSIESMRRRTAPGVPFLGYGHRLSFGIVARESLTPADARRLASAAAGAVATFDQRGCVSPHLFYVEEGGAAEPREWAVLLAEAMRELESTLPRGSVAPGEAAAIRQARAEAEFAQLAGSAHELHASSSGTAWTVIFDPDPTFTPSCLNRVARVKPIATLERLPELLKPVAGVLQTVGVAASEERSRTLAERLGRLGVSRVSSLEGMAWPPPTWHHDGRPPLLDLLRWCDWE